MKRFKLSPSMMEWSPSRRTDGSIWFDPDGKPHYWYYINWWNWLPKSLRSIGYETIEYDHQVHELFGFYYFNISWSLPSSQRKRIRNV